MSTCCKVRNRPDNYRTVISGPIHAGTWGPAPLDNTFGPAAMFQKGCSAEQGENLAPCFGLQFFGHVAIDAATEVMTVTLKDVDDRNLWSTQIEPKRPHLVKASGLAAYPIR
jgi:alkaline phosphatase D